MRARPVVFALAFAACILIGCASVPSDLRLVRVEDPIAAGSLTINLDACADPRLEEGHQPWLADDWVVAGIAMRERLGLGGDPFSDGDAARSRLVFEGRDAAGRAEEVIERSLGLPPAAPIAGLAVLRHPIARVHLVRAPHGAWIATRIVLASR